MQEVEKMMIENWIYNVLNKYNLKDNEELREKIFECVEKIYSKDKSITGEQVNLDVLKLALEALTFNDIQEKGKSKSLEIVAYSYFNDSFIKVELENYKDDSFVVNSFES